MVFTSLLQVFVYKCLLTAFILERAYIPYCSYQVKPVKSSLEPWFTPECAAAIFQRDRFFHQYKRNRSPGNLE